MFSELSNFDNDFCIELLILIIEVLPESIDFRYAQSNMLVAGNPLKIIKKIDAQ